MSIVRAVGSGSMESLESAAQAARGYVDAARSANTVRAYRSDWRHFTTWCTRHGIEPLKAAPEMLALYLADLAGEARSSTVQRRMSALSVAFDAAGGENPTRSPVVRSTISGIRRVHGTAPRQVAPAVVADLRAMVATLDHSAAGARDRALLLVGFAAALRRSELVALNVSDAQEVPEGVVVTLRRSKTDQEGGGRRVAVPYGSSIETCPVRALRAWRIRLDEQVEPLFVSIDRHGNLGARLTGAGVALIIKRAADRAGLDSQRYSGHSLRAGLATSAAAAGVPERIIQRTTGHRSLEVLRRYIREGELFSDVAAAQVGL